MILFFSYSGATKDMLDVLRPARRRGAKIILVTHFAKSPAAAMADVTLLCGSKEGPLQSGSVAAKMGLLFIIDVLFNEYCPHQSRPDGGEPRGYGRSHFSKAAVSTERKGCDCDGL